MKEMLAGLIFIIGLVMGWYIRDVLPDPVPEMVITPAGQTTTVRRRAVDPRAALEEQAEFYRNCFHSPVDISIIQDKKKLIVTARDECRESSRDFVLEVSRGPSWKVYAGVAAAGIVTGFLLSLR